jgi:hypothetical protein
MSIQKRIQSKPVFLILEKFYLISLYDFFIQLVQKFQRTGINSKIFYPYYSSYTHPFLKKSFYNDNAPFSWCNYKHSKIIWAIQHPKSNYCFEKDIVIEPNDHILTISHFFGARTPKECLDKVPDVKKLLENNHVKAILISGPGLREQFQYYFGNNLLHKIKEYPIMRCVPKFSLKNRENLFIRHEPNFLCIATDFKVKAIELLIIAWQKVANKTKLVIVCDNIPKELIEKVKNDNSIVVIKKSPISENLKHSLLINSSISFCLTHVDGGTTVNEALEYGHAIITCDFHRYKQLIQNDNGIVVPFKNKYYDPGRFGIEWNSIAEYLRIVDTSFKNGDYNVSLDALSDAIRLLIANPSTLRQMRLNSLELAHKDSIIESNLKLQKIFQEIIDHEL